MHSHQEEVEESIHIYHNLCYQHLLKFYPITILTLIWRHKFPSVYMRFSWQWWMAQLYPYFPEGALHFRPTLLFLDLPSDIHPMFFSFSLSGEIFLLLESIFRNAGWLPRRPEASFHPASTSFSLRNPVSMNSSPFPTWNFNMSFWPLKIWYIEDCNEKFG